MTRYSISGQGHPESGNSNVGLRLSQHAERAPEQLAIATATGSHRQGTNRSYSTITMADLDRRSTSIAAGLQGIGIGPGKRIALLVRFGEDFITLVFALLKSGATLILIDPGMGRKHILNCLSEARPDGFVGIPLAQAIVKAKRSLFPHAHLNVTVGRRFGILPSPTLHDLERTYRAGDFLPPETQMSDPAAIIFTTGSTGPPKGVLYTHRTFHSQIDMISTHYGIASGRKDLSGFPLFGLFNAVMGTSTILPDMDPTRPASVIPKRLLDAIEQWQIDQSFGSPALWTRVGEYCKASGRRMESLRLVLSAGAPVPARVLEQIRGAMHPDGMMYTPYGATEALPVASIESREVLQETRFKTEKGAGTCVGKPFPGIHWKVIAITDEPIPTLNQAREVAQGEIGELMVSGPPITQTYVTRIDQNAIHKVAQTDNTSSEKLIWHRMGDVGYLDAQGRFWYCGRKGHRVTTRNQTLFTEPVEAVINTHPNVFRSALVPIGTAPDQRPCIIIEPWAAKRKDVEKNLESNRSEWLALIRDALPDVDIENFLVYPKSLPTDIRHNAKIFREKLKPWAEKQILKQAK
jgi:acyl-CoA synthetase (AMP-forming)/AMP-acid ligase II